MFKKISLASFIIASSLALHVHASQFPEFNKDDYLAANPDVAAHIKAHNLNADSFAKSHYDQQVIPKNRSFMPKAKYLEKTKFMGLQDLAAKSVQQLKYLRAANLHFLKDPSVTGDDRYKILTFDKYVTAALYDKTNPDGDAAIDAQVRPFVKKIDDLRRAGSYKKDELEKLEAEGYALLQKNLTDLQKARIGYGLKELTMYKGLAH